MVGLIRTPARILFRPLLVMKSSSACRGSGAVDIGDDGTLLADWKGGGAMDDVPQDVDGEELDLPLNQEPGTAAPEIEINYEVERGQEDRELDKDEAERQELDRSEAGM
jgi:hypothetical protein